MDNYLEKLLRAFEKYYDINRDHPAPPFCAEADFRLHDEQYFLIRSAKLAERDTREILFFAVSDTLTPEIFQSLDQAAWETGLARAQVRANHQFTDIGLVILAGSVSGETQKLIRKTNRTKSYLFGMRGYSRYRLIAYDCSQGSVVRNRMGDTLEQVIRNTLQHRESTKLPAKQADTDFSA